MMIRVMALAGLALCTGCASMGRLEAGRSVPTLPAIAELHSLPSNSVVQNIRALPTLPGIAALALPQEQRESPPPEFAPEEAERRARSMGHKMIFYIPNRMFDMLDLVRFRLRVGPGFGVGARVTKPISAFVGFYSTLWVGVPGPRTRPKLNLPVGLEARAGAQASVADVTSTGGVEYGFLEVGADFQLALLGLALGFDIFEPLDFMAGIFMFDPRGDDF